MKTTSNLTKFIRNWLNTNGTTEEHYWIYNDKTNEGRSIKLIWSGLGEVSFHFNRRLYTALKQEGYTTKMVKSFEGKWRIHVVDAVA